MPVSTTASHQLYSQRQVYPFSACIQVIETPFIRALSVDSVNWQIQTICESHQQEWNIIPDPGLQRRYVLYGHWSQTNGLSRLPLDPYLDVPAPEQINIIIDALSLHARETPFPPGDHYELWLLDKSSQRPLILLATRTSQYKINLQPTDDWSLQRQFISSNPTLSGFIHHHLKQQLTNPFCFQWFKRNPANGEGYSIDTSGTTHHPYLDASQFPALLIRDQWNDPDINHQFASFLNNFAPQLLTLPSLPDSRRQLLEIAAQSQPLLVNRYYRSYPKIIDQKLLNKILVEAQFRNNL